MLKPQKNNHPSQLDDAAVLKRVRKNVYQQAALAVFMVVLIAVVIFATTAAWYTNVAETSGLVFDVSAWGFGGIVTEDTYIQAAPGDEGIIELTAENDSDSVMAVSVNISKLAMDPEMQKRLYFYVDTPRAVTYTDGDGEKQTEIAERIYLNNSGGYTYTLFNHNDLILTETVHNGPLLKWHWVYDVLGYYVLGTLDEDGMVEVEEYLRPIEYDYDEATTTFEKAEDGTLTGSMVTVDGETSLEDFLVSISERDGYAGTIDTAEVTDGGYYPVEVVTDEEGNKYGVWAYLCSYTEIMNNIAYDTWLGENAAANAGESEEEDSEGSDETGEAEETTADVGTYVATLTMVAQNSDVETVLVSTADGLTEALTAAREAGESVVVQLASDMTLYDPLTVTASEKVMLDLNDNTLTLDSGTYADKAGGLQVEPGSSLTVVDGTLLGADASGVILSGSGAEITFSGVTIADADTFLYVRDHKAEVAADSRIHLVNCDVSTAQTAILLTGNGSDSAQVTSLVIENSVIESQYISIVGNGSEGQNGTDIQIIASTIKGAWSGVYHPQNDSTLTISNGSVIEGYTALAIKGGTVRVIDSTITGTGEKQPADYAVSGFTDTGDAIYIETNYEHEIVLDISVTTGDTYVGETFVTATDGGYALQVYKPDADNVSVTIHGGIFSSDVSKYLADGCVCNELDSGDYAGMYIVGVGAVEAALDDETEEITPSDEEAT